jgi:PhnB protein
MAERDLIQQLDQAIAAMLAGGPGIENRLETGPEVTALLRIAGPIRDLPDTDFRERLKREVIASVMKSSIKEKTMTATTPETTSKSWMPEGFRSLTPYLLAPSSAKLMDFMKNVFDAAEIARHLRPDGTVMHGVVKIGDSVIEFGENPPDQFGARPTPLHVYVPDVDATYARALAAGATSIRGPEDHEYGERGASLVDAAGNHWYVATARGSHHIPEGLNSVNISLHAKGTSAFIDFLKRAFGAEEIARHERGGAIVHAGVRIGDSVLEMGEAHDPYGPMPCAIHLYVPDADAVYRQALEAGAASVTAPMNAPYGDRYSSVLDPQKNYWYIATHLTDFPQ